MAMKSWSFITLVMASSFFVTMFAGHAVRVPFSSQNLSKPTTKHQDITDAETVSAGYSFVISLYPFRGQTWHGECFQDNYGYVTYTQEGSLGYVVIQPSNAKSKGCWDYYEFKVGDQTIGTDSIFSSWTSHETAFDASDRELKKKIKANGVALYIWRNGLNVNRNQKEKAFEEHSDQSSKATNVMNVDGVRSEDKSYSAA